MNYRMERQYSNEDYVDMNFIYGKTKAPHLYYESFLIWQKLVRQAFIKMF